LVDTYRGVLTVPGAAMFAVAGLVARLPISMLGIGIVLLVEGSTGSYALAGWVAAAYGVVQAVASPYVARLVDGHGQARVMRPAIAVHVLGLVLMMVAASLAAPRWTLFASAVVMGATIGSVGALVRTRWSHALSLRADGAQLLHTAYSLESVFDEVVFVTGPLLVTVLATAVSPVAGLIAAALAVAVGGGWLLSQHATEPPLVAAHARGGRSAALEAGMPMIVLSFVGVGAIFGGVEVVTIAFTDRQGTPGQAGPVLAVFALASMLSGVVYGAVQWRTRASRRYLLGVMLLALGVSPLLAVRSTLWLAVVVFVAGFAIAPMLISGNAVVQELVPAGKRTEGLTWVATGLGLGVSAGAALSGVAVERLGTPSAFVVPVAAGLFSVLVTLAGARQLSR